MSGKIIILLIIAIGIGYYVIQKFFPENRGGNMTGGRRRDASEWDSDSPRQNHPINEEVHRMPATTLAPPVNRQTMRPPLIPAARDKIMETGPMIYFANDRHGRNDREYRFNYKKIGNGWRAYILRMPSIGARDSSSGVIHRLQDNNGYYICWDRQVNTLKDMQTISRRWADSIQEYISSGRFG